MPAGFRDIASLQGLYPGAATLPQPPAGGFFDIMALQGAIPLNGAADAAPSGGLLLGQAVGAWLTGASLIPPPTEVIEPESGDRGFSGPGYSRQYEDALRETRRKRILQEDNDIVELIVAMLTGGLK